MFIHRFRDAARLLGCILLHAASTSHAQAPATLTLDLAIERTLASNPDLKAQGFELSIQEARVLQAKARPPLEIGALAENVAGSGAHQGVDAAEFTLSLGIVLERGARDRRVEVAEAGLALAQDERNAKRLDIAAETARRYITVLTLQQELEELHQVAKLAEETHITVKERVDAAKAPSAEAARAYAQLARAQISEEHGEHELITAKLRLAAMWGEGAGGTQASVGSVRGDVLVLPKLAEFEAWRSELAKNPDLSKLLTTQRVRESELRLAETKRRLPWHVNVGVRRFEATDDQAFVAGITIPLANRRSYDGVIAQSRAQSQQLHAQTEAMKLTLDVELFAIYQDLQHAYTEFEGLRDGVLPRMETALDESRYAYERGRYSYAEWVAAQRELAEIRQAMLEAAANAHRYRIEIERLIGATLTQRFNP